ncbi:MAG: iron ABC transporter substrate-binding protein, partial [Halobacteria archaeon]|nr:iron ABC transporter substrate-binding protein [Halobacteria archaeon]
MKRREYVASVGSLVAGAGCLGGGSNGNGSAKVFDNSSKPTSEVPTIDELPDLSGELTLYLGRGEGGLYRKVITDLQSYYSDLTLNVKRSSSSQLANVLLTEDRTPADAFISIDAGSLGAVAEAGIAADLPKEVLSQVPDNFAGANDHWVGIAGRARSIPYNTDKYDESEIPDD